MAALVYALEAIANSNEDLYAIELDEVEIVFRLPTIKQVQQYSKLLSLATDIPTRNIIYEHIFKTAVIDEFLANRSGDIPAGVPETISNLIFMLSGLDNKSIEYTEELLKVYRSKINGGLSFMKRTICSVFAGYTFEALDKLTYQNIIAIFTQAEAWLLENDRIVDVYSFVDPQQEQQSAYKPFKVEDVIKRDAEEHAKFETPSNPSDMAKMGKLRQEAIERARREELAYKKRFIKR